jgi:hypothetical protein
MKVDLRKSQTLIQKNKNKNKNKNNPITDEVKGVKRIG